MCLNNHSLRSEICKHLSDHLKKNKLKKNEFIEKEVEQKKDDVFHKYLKKVEPIKEEKE